MNDPHVSLPIGEVSLETLNNLQSKSFDAILLTYGLPSKTKRILNSELSSCLFEVTPSLPSSSCEDNCNQIIIHPIIFDFLTKSSLFIVDEDGNIKDEGRTTEMVGNNKDAVSLTISPSTSSGILSEEESYYDYTDNDSKNEKIICDNTTSSLWTGKKVIVNDLPMDCTIDLNCFHLDDELSSITLDQLEHTITRSLEGRLIMTGTVTVLLTYDEYLIIVIVSSVTTSAGINDNSSDVLRNEKTAYRVGMHHNYSVKIDRNSNCWSPSLGNTLTNIEAENNSTLNLSEKRMKSSQKLGDIDDIDCPGYESMIIELIQLICVVGSNRIAIPSGILLTGCTGVGKTRIASHVAYRCKTESSVNVHWVTVHDLLLRAAWASENDMMEFMNPSSTNCNSNCNDNDNFVRNLLIIDDLHLLVSEDGNGLDPERMVVLNSILQTMDKLSHENTNKDGRGVKVINIVLGIGITAAQLPTSLVRISRFEKEVTIAQPTQFQREAIFMHMLEFVETETTRKKYATALSTLTPGCVAGDILHLLTNAWTKSCSRKKLQRKWNDKYPTGFDDFSIRSCLPSWNDLQEAAFNCIPSQLSVLDVSKPIIGRSSAAISAAMDNDEKSDSKNNINESIIDLRGFHELSWSFFGGYNQVKKRVYRNVVLPWKKNLDEFEKQEKKEEESNKILSSGVVGLANNDNNLIMKIPPRSGVLFHGPSGCGKTMAANCLASSLGFPMIRIRPSDVLDKWLGGSESILRSIFARARASAPCILFFDEIDSICSNRNDFDNGDGGNSNDDFGGVMSGLLSTFLNEMDGISSSNDQNGKIQNNNILVVGCTNRFKSLDSALLRPGRLEEHILLDKPTCMDIFEILNIHLSSVPLENDVDLRDLADTFYEHNATCADIEGICRDVCLLVLNRVDEFDDPINDTTGDNNQSIISSIRISKNDFDNVINSSFLERRT